ncbi:GNAT family N-acetyltransferase [Profundibacter sp.]|uniref:GNAT family N-acetyltransferase n=1 Tax=Profundibacter sp. TaxID=3101071 RepID=UPI003D0B4D43
MNIKEAGLEDCQGALAVAREFHSESNFRDVPFSDEKVLSLFDFAIKSPNHLFLIFEQDNEVIGGFIGYLDYFYFSDAVVASDLALFVLKEKRGKVPMRKVLNIYRVWASRRGAMRINIALSTGINTDRVERLFELLGFEKSGANFAFFPQRAKG